MPVSKKTQPKEDRNIYKVTLRGNKKENTIDVVFQPALVNTKVADTQILLNVLTAGTHAGFIKLLGGLPILRAATEAEREAKIYVYVDDKERNVQKMRKDLYDQLEAVFSTILTQLFPDIEYIESCNTYQQDLAFEMNETQAEDYKKEIEAITKKVIEDYEASKETVQ